MDDLIAVRIKDGVFAGNSGAAADKTFLIMNKITHVINCAGAEVGDFFLGEPGFSYLSFPWKDAAGSVCTTILFDAADDNVTRAVKFIDEALAEGECVLVHSVYGKSRAPALITAYFIMKYGWKLESALAYMNMAHPDMEIKPHFQRQLRQFAKRHDADRDVFAKDVDDSVFGLDNDQWMLRNTLLNGLLYDTQMANELYKQCAERVDVGTPINAKPTRPRITFVDTKKGTDTESKQTCPVVNSTTPFHADPATMDPGGFIGLRGSSSLRSPRRSPSILSRSTSPCARHLVSDPQSCPKGRQTLVVVHSGASEIGTSTASGKVERPPSLRTHAPAARSHSSSSHLSDRERPKTRESEIDSFLAQPRQPSIESTRSIDYSRLAPPTTTQGRSPFATLASSHKYRNGSPLPLPKDKKATASKGSRTKISSTTAVVKPSAANSTPVAPPATAAAATATVRSSSSSAQANPSAPPQQQSTPTPAVTALVMAAAGAASAGRPLVRTSSPRLDPSAPSREIVMGRPSSAAVGYRGIAPSRSVVSMRVPDTASRTGSRTSSPARQRADGAAPDLRSASSGGGGSSRRRTLSPAASPALSPAQSPARQTAPSGKRRGTTEEKKPTRTRSPKTHKTQSTNDSFASPDSSNGGAASKNPVTVHRQLPPAIASRRQ